MSQQIPPSTTEEMIENQTLDLVSSDGVSQQPLSLQEEYSSSGQKKVLMTSEEARAHVEKIKAKEQELLKQEQALLKQEQELLKQEQALLKQEQELIKQEKSEKVPSQTEKKAKTKKSAEQKTSKTKKDTKKDDGNKKQDTDSAEISDIEIQEILHETIADNEEASETIEANPLSLTQTLQDTPDEDTVKVQEGIESMPETNSAPEEGYIQITFFAIAGIAFIGFMVLMYKLFPKKAEIQAVIESIETTDTPDEIKPTIIQPIQTATVDISAQANKSTLEIPPIFDLPSEVGSGETVIMMHDAPTAVTSSVSVPKVQKPLHDLDNDDDDDDDLTLFGSTSSPKKPAKKGATTTKMVASKTKKKETKTVEKKKEINSNIAGKNKKSTSDDTPVDTTNKKSTPKKEDIPPKESNKKSTAPDTKTEKNIKTTESSSNIAKKKQKNTPETNPTKTVASKTKKKETKTPTSQKKKQ